MEFYTEVIEVKEVNEVNEVKELNELNDTNTTKIFFQHKISVYIISFYDFGFLNTIIDKIYSLVDEIILVDGPYIYCIDVLNKLNLLYDETCKPIDLTKILIKYSNKIKYFYQVFNSQEEKRIFGYNKCTNDLILLIDSDDYCILNEEDINLFIKSKKSVASVDIYNMNRANVIMNNKIEKNILFKKKFITAEDHLLYTWCYDQNNKTNIQNTQNKTNIQNTQNKTNISKFNNNSPNPDYIYSKKIGIIYHQTLNRNKSDSIIKFIYYICLYYYKKNSNQIVTIDNLPLVGDFTITKLLNYLSIDEILDIFYHSKIELIGFPEKDRILSHIPDVQETLSMFLNNQVDAFFIENSLAIRHIPYYCILNIDKTNINEIEIIFDNVTQIQITIYEINLDEPYKIFKKTYTFCTEKIIIDYIFKKKGNYFTTVMQFNCLYTVDNTNKYIIKNINFHD